MSTIARALALALLLVSAIPISGLSMCVPFPCSNDCFIESQGQLNFVVVDRQAGTVELIPNIRIVGRSEDFSLIVPTPSVPELTPVDAGIWTQASQLSAPVRLPTRSSGSACGRSFNPSNDLPPQSAEDAGVTVIDTQVVGGFDATILTADSVDALTEWLADNGFMITPEESSRFAPFVARGWVFTAMKPSASGNMPINGWRTNVDPVAFRYEASEFELAVPLIAIHRAGQMPVVTYVVDDFRTELAGYATLYANRITATEHAAIAETYPVLAPFMTSGRFITRLDRTYTRRDAMDAPLVATRAATDAEFRRTVGALRSTIPASYVLLLLPVLWHRMRHRRRP